MKSRMPKMCVFILTPLLLSRGKETLDLLLSIPYTDYNRTRHASGFTMRNPAGLFLTRSISLWMLRNIPL